MCKYILSWALILSSCLVFSQDLNKLNAKFGFYDNVQDARINTVQLYKTGNTLADPIIKLNSTETLTLNFDDVNLDDEEYRDFYYTVTHCDADWQKSNIILNEYMNGYEKNDIIEINQSMGTSVPYYNYEVVLPNDDVQLKISGNYIIRVFDRDSKKLVIEKSFRIYQPIAGINTDFKSSVNSKNQHLEIKVNHGSLLVRNPDNNFKVRVFQNNITFPDKVPKSTFTQSNRTDYTHPEKSEYLGINEFRSFDTRNLNYRGRGVKDIDLYDDGSYNIILITDEDRSYKDYTFVKDANGKYVISSEKAYNENTQSDYTDVTFTLNIRECLNCRVFVFGELTDWALSEKFELKYFPEDDLYGVKTTLKQGYYNYRYVLVYNEKEAIDYTLLENSFYETENDYNVYVYYKDVTDRYEKLVGYEKINSRSTSFLK